MEAWIRGGTVWLAVVIDVIAALVIAGAALMAAFGLMRSGGTGPEAARLQLGRWMLLGLEFLLAADLLRSTAAPTWTSLGQLAVVVVIRTVLDVFLVRDVEAADRRHQAPPPS